MGRKTTKNNFDHLEENMFPYFGEKQRHWKILKAGVPGYFSDPDPSLGVSRPHPFQQFGAARSPELWRSPSVAEKKATAATAARNLLRTQLVTVSSCNFFNSPSKWSLSANAAWSKSHQIPKLHGSKKLHEQDEKITLPEVLHRRRLSYPGCKSIGISWDIQWFNYLIVCPCKPKFQESRKLRPQTGDDSYPVTENPTPELVLVRSSKVLKFPVRVLIYCE